MLSRCYVDLYVLRCIEMYRTLDEDDIHVKIRLKMQTSRH